MTTNETPQATPWLNLSICIIARPDDAGWMPELMKSLPAGVEICILWNRPGECEDYDDEGTKQLANGTTVRYHRWTWTGTFSFSEARNLCIGSATRGWIMWLDADDRLLPHQHAMLATLDDTYGPGIGGLLCGVTGVNPPSPGNPEGQVYGIPQIRLFRNGHNFRFRGRCHEQISPSIYEAAMQIVPCPIIVHHVGYEVDEEVMIAKMRRNTKLLALQFANEEYNPEFTAKMLHRDLQNLLSLTRAQPI